MALPREARLVTPVTRGERPGEDGLSGHASAGAPHFANREAPLAALALRGYEEQARRFAEAVGRSEDPVDQLGEFAAARRAQDQARAAARTLAAAALRG
jgi:hypothetical protein